jgi:hypothetical protein
VCSILAEAAILDGRASLNETDWASVFALFAIHGLTAPHLAPTKCVWSFAMTQAIPSCSTA